jgi:hypothetical protein
MPTPAFRDWVDRARGVHVNAILSTHHIALTGKGNKRAGPCPKCGGDDRFAVDLGKELFNCRGCGAKGHGAISLEQFIAGQSFLQAVETITGEPPPKDEPKGQKPRSRKPRGKFVCAYSYVDEVDVEQYQVCRYADPKSFSQRRPDPDRPGEWIGNLADVRLVPYRLGDLIEGISNGHPVYWCEGEKDSDNGADKLGLITTTTAMGTAGKGFWQRGAYDEFFRDADVVLVPDQDDDDKKGAELARIIGKRLKPIAARVRVLNLPNAKDLSLWIEAGGTREQFDALPLTEFVTSNGANGHDAEGMSDFAQVWEVPPQYGEPPPEPIKYLSKQEFVTAFVPPEYLVDGMLQRRFVYSLTGQTGHAKTAIALHIAERVASHDRNATIGRHKADNGHVAYFAGENPDDLRMRVIGADAKRVEADARDTPMQDNIHFIPGVFDIAQMYAALATHVEESGGVALVVVDTSAAYFLGDEENSNAQMGAHARKLRKLTELPGGPCVLVLCHPTKAAIEPDHLLPRGGGAFLAEVDGNLTVWKHDDNLIRLHHNKMRGPGFEPMSFQLEPVKTEKLIDSKNRLIPTVRAVSITAAAEEQQQDKSEDEERAVLAAYLAIGPQRPSIADIARWLSSPNTITSDVAQHDRRRALGWTFANGDPYKSKVQRVIDRLTKNRKPPLLTQTRGEKYQLTEPGKVLARDYAIHPRPIIESQTDDQDELL